MSQILWWGGFHRYDRKREGPLSAMKKVERIFGRGGSWRAVELNEDTDVKNTSGTHFTVCV